MFPRRAGRLSLPDRPDRIEQNNNQITITRSDEGKSVRKHNRTFPVSALACAISLSSVAMAQTEDDTGSDAQARSTIEEVQVTGRYRQESVQEIPTAVTAFNDSMLEKVAAQDLRDVGPATPNVRIQPVSGFNNAANIYMRGMGQVGIESTEESRVGLSVDGIVITRPAGSLIDFFDVDSVEVMRGPTGTTFGKNSLSGGIAVKTKKPSNEFGGKVEVTGGNYGRKDLRAAVEMPLVADELAVRFSLLEQNYGGHFTNRVNGDSLGGEDVLTGRATVAWTPSDSVDAIVRVWHVKDRSDAPGADSDPYPDQILCSVIQWCGEPDNDPYTVGSDAPNVAYLDQTGFASTVNWDLNDWVLTSVTGYIETDDLTANDFDHTEIPFFPTSRDQTHDQLSQEFRLSTRLWDNTDFVVGAFYMQQEHEIVQNFPTLGPSADYTTQEAESKAVFSQAIYDVSDRLSLTLGLRYSQEDKEFLRNPGVYFADIGMELNTHKSIDLLRGLTQEELALGSERLVQGTLDSSRLTSKFGMDYQFNDDLMGYFSYSEGYKAGEFGARAASPITAGPTDDETSRSYELGAKSEWFDGRVRANVAAFYTDYNNLQISAFVPSSFAPSGQESALSNIAGATTQGVEFEVTAMPTDQLTLQANIGILDAEYTDFCADLDGPSVVENPVSSCGGVIYLDNGQVLVDEDHSDSDMTRAPALDAYLSAEYVQPLPIGWGELSGRVSLSYTDEFRLAISDSPKTLTGDERFVDANITWRSAGESVRATLWGKNLTDTHMVNGFVQTANYFNQRYFDNPKTFGLTVAVDF